MLVQKLYKYSKVDHGKSLKTFFGPRCQLTHFGITSKQYDNCYVLDTDLYETGMALTNVVINAYGFKNLIELRRIYAISHIYNSYTYVPNEHIYETLRWRYEKARTIYPELILDPPPESGNMVEYLEKFHVKHFVQVGW